MSKFGGTAYKYRFYPTQEQRDILTRTFGCVRFVYNWGLHLKVVAYHDREERLYYKDLSAQLTLLKQQKETVWLNEVSSVVLQQALRHLDRAFINFFEGRAEYPKFRKKISVQSATYVSNAFKWDGENLTLAKMREPLNIRWSFGNKAGIGKREKYRFSGYIPDSRLHPNKITTADLQEFKSNAIRAVAELRPFYELAIFTVKRVKECSLPLTLVHGDCWSANAVIPSDGTSMLIDWGFSGIGPAVLELGYLLMACHVDRPQIPKFVPDLDRISAVLRGYSRQYKLGSKELSALVDAIAYDPSRRLIRLMLNHDLSSTIENWKENGLLRTLISRLSASPQIAEIVSSGLRSHDELS